MNKFQLVPRFILSKLLYFARMQNNQFLLYGANGYTGQIIARYAKQYGLQPILAGRRETPLRKLAAELKMPYKVFDLSDTSALEAALREVPVVVHAAGPYDHTAKPMIEACVRTGTHYLDLNGDMNVYETLESYHAVAKAADIMVLPGAGFDVVPTDCLALFLKNMHPGATSLQLAFAMPGGQLSRGTAITTVLKLGEAGAERKNGKIVPVPVGQKGKTIDFGPEKFFVMSLPWGDVFTAYHTTGIENIVVYTNISPAVYYFLKFQRLFNWILRTTAVRKLANAIIEKRGPGPSADERKKSVSLVWGQTTDNQGKTTTARLRGPDAYDITAYSVLLIIQKIMQGNYKAGYQTPGSAYGPDLIMEVPEVSRELAS